MERIEEMFDKLMYIHDNACLCDHHNKELSDIFNQLDKFYNSLVTANHDISDSEYEISMEFTEEEDSEDSECGVPLKKQKLVE